MPGPRSNYGLRENQLAAPLSADAAISFDSPLGRGSRVVSWTTNAERDLRGFNIVVRDERDCRQIDGGLILYDECTIGRGSTDSTIIPEHRGGRNIYIEAVHRNGQVETFGPALRL